MLLGDGNDAGGGAFVMFGLMLLFLVIAGGMVALDARRGLPASPVDALVVIIFAVLAIHQWLLNRTTPRDGEYLAVVGDSGFGEQVCERSRRFRRTLIGWIPSRTLVVALMVSLTLQRPPSWPLIVAFVFIGLFPLIGELCHRRARLGTSSEGLTRYRWTHVRFVRLAFTRSGHRLTIKGKRPAGTLMDFEIHGLDDESVRQLIDFINERSPVPVAVEPRRFASSPA